MQETYEIELKTEIKDPKFYRKKLGEPIRKFFFVDVIFDTEEKSLESSDSLMRIRRYEDRAVLTYKGPREDSVAKKRVEIELDIDDPEKMEQIFVTMGYLSKFRNERRREVYDYMGAEVVIDELPKLGFFVEIEAPDEDTILRVAESLEIPKDKLTNRTYLELIEEYKSKTGEKFKDLRF